MEKLRQGSKKAEKAEKPWTDKQKLAYAKQMLRRSFKRTRSYNEIINSHKTKTYVKLKSGETGKAYLVTWTCKACGKEGLGRREIEVDHIQPIGHATSMEEWILSLYCDLDDLQILCKMCHKVKSKQDVAEIREEKKKRSSK
jgi:hypothetical protein